MVLPMFLRVLAYVVVLLAIVAMPTMDRLFAQRQSPAAGPWSGQAECVVVDKSADYLDEQTHTWRLTGAAPTAAPAGSSQVYYTWPATWRVQGSGRKAFQSSIPAAGREQSERWTIANEMTATLRITELPGSTVRLRIGADGQRGAPPGSIRVTEVSGRTRDGSVQPWPFPPIEDDATKSTISGSSTRTYPEGVGNGWSRPPKAITTATCTWSFTRGGVDQSSANPPTGGRGRPPIAGLVVAPPAETASSEPRPITATPGGIAGPASSDRLGRAAGGNSTSTTVPPGTQAATVPTNTGELALGTPIDKCTLPVAVVPGSVVVSPGRVYAKLTGIRLGCEGCSLGTPFGTRYQARYTIYRSDRSEPIGQMSGSNDFVDFMVMMEFGRTYSFSIVAEAFHQPYLQPAVSDGCGRTQLPVVTPPLPATPVIWSVYSKPGWNEVSIGWNCVNQGESGYLVIGPGLGSQGTVQGCNALGEGYMVIRSLPSGTHSWVITPFWDTPEGRLIDVNRGARVTATSTGP